VRFLTVEFADRADKVAPVPAGGDALGRFRIASLEPCPHAFVVAVGQAFGEIVRFLVESVEECAYRLLVVTGHEYNDGPHQGNKQAWP